MAKTIEEVKAQRDALQTRVGALEIALFKLLTISKKDEHIVGRGDDAKWVESKDSYRNVIINNAQNLLEVNELYKAKDSDIVTVHGDGKLGDLI